MMDAILADRLVVVTTMSGGKWSGAVTVAPDADPVTALRVTGVGEVVIVRSFSGRLDPRHPSQGLKTRSAKSAKRSQS
jgi:hypothetical protein